MLDTSIFEKLFKIILFSEKLGVENLKKLLILKITYNANYEKLISITNDNFVPNLRPIQIFCLSESKS